MMRAAAFWLGLALCVGVPAGLIVQKEHLLTTGRVVLLRLVPVDPRSLMQGDYMALRYAVGDALFEADGERLDAPNAPTVVIVAVDADGVATHRRLDDGGPLAPDEQRLRFRHRGGAVSFGAEAYFFEEGRGEYFEAARYGELRVSEDGVALLAGLRDSDRNPL
jgi:uncharacterized membrane-anchored protein